jgi:hypothetical protein
MLVFRPHHRPIQEFLYHLQQIDLGSKENRNPWLIKYYQEVSLGLTLWLSLWCQGKLKRLNHTSVSCLNPYISFYENCSLKGKDRAECKIFISYEYFCPSVSVMFVSVLSSYMFFLVEIDMF